jgi:hypothetical protein
MIIFFLPTAVPRNERLRKIQAIWVSLHFIIDNLKRENVVRYPENDIHAKEV